MAVPHLTAVKIRLILPTEMESLMTGTRKKTGHRPGALKRSGPVKPHPAVVEKLRQAMGFHGSGQLAMADHLYREVLEFDGAQPDALHWLGVLEGQAGNLQRACELIGLSVQGRPDDPSAWNDLGTAQRVLNRREDALASFERAIALNPRFAKAHRDKAGVLRELGRLEHALRSAEYALTVAPGDVESCLLSAQIQSDLGAIGTALQACWRALELENSDRTHAAFAGVLQLMRFERQAPELLPFVVSAIATPWGRPNDLAPAAASLLLQEPAIRSLADRVAALGGEPAEFDALFAGDDALADTVGAHPLMLALLNCVLVGDRQLQRLLAALRRAFLLLPPHRRQGVSHEQRVFLSALAQQSFINEYVFDVDPMEVFVLGRLRDDIERSLAQGGSEPDEVSIMLLVAYQPLGSINGIQALLEGQSSSILSAIIRQQALDPALERDLARDIRALTPIDDSVSRAVQAQYEVNPYPRWVGYPRNTVPSTVDQYLGSRFPQATFQPLGRENSGLDILIAGCGTGQHAIEAASFFRGANILAIDLSRSSLAYAKRKTREFDIAGLDYAQADILALGGTGRKFEIIESIGVLHHLAEPLEGWRVLLGCLKAGGFMRIGLYSEIARQPVVAIREFIAQRGYPATTEGIRACRAALLSGEGPKGVDAVLDSPDFHSTSAIRDLLFHVSEHRYTLSRLRQELDDLGLSFIGFELPASIEQLFRRQFPNDALINDLDSWDAFERLNPAAFSAMYVFWVQRC